MDGTDTVIAGVALAIGIVAVFVAWSYVGPALSSAIATPTA